MTDIETYRKMLPVNKHRLDDELEIQPEIMMRIASTVVTMTGRMLQAKDDLARIEARLSEEAKDDDPKLSITGVDQRVRRHKERIGAWDAYQHARTDLEHWTFMLECWRQKGFSIKTLSDLYTAQYFSTNSALAPRTVARMQQQDDARAAMRRASHSPLMEPQPDEPAPRRRAVL